MYLTSGYSDNSVVYENSWFQWAGYCEPVKAGNQLLSVTIKLDSGSNWSVGGSSSTYDIQTLAQHELGHALGVAHCHEASAGEGPCWSATCLINVMYTITWNGKVTTTLKEYDTSSYIMIYS